MIFLSYDFVLFALAFFVLYVTLPAPQLRLALIIMGGLWFQAFYGGLSSAIPVMVLAAASYLAARSGRPIAIFAAIALAALALIFYKYTRFLASAVIGPLVNSGAGAAVDSLAPAAIPLGISFFVFEFIHYLVDVHRGRRPIERFADFAAFALFWPTMVAGPIKRYHQFVPALHQGVKGSWSTLQMQGFARVAIGFAKKLAADNLTGWIVFMEPQLAGQTLAWRWLFLSALAFRILLDFSGYSDMAIGYARIMGIVVPENFSWPYLARSPMEFWRSWHMSLSSWILDYIYIPLGGNRLGVPRRLLNAIAAMTICGLWHGAAWNFALWGIYHGIGLAVAAALQDYVRMPAKLAPAVIVLGWASTLLFVWVGWLLFFYPPEKALALAALLLPGAP